jgi:pilus assembly protein Flp/PilA
MKTFATRFLADQSGATAIEYGLIAALVSITIIAAAAQIGGGTKSQFERVQSAVEAAPAN